MRLQTVDWTIVIGFLVLWIAIGLLLARRASRGAAEFFLAGRSMPWWLLGVSMVATTFSTDTPNLVTGFVRSEGVAGNWRWWGFLLSGMTTAFLFAKLWRKSGVLTDMELYELRYSGRVAAFLRGFRAIYLGLFLNVIIMAGVTLAATKIGGVLLGVRPETVVLVAGTATVVYSLLGGLTGVLITDLIQFAVAMVGSFAAAYVALNHPDVGGLSGLLSHPNVTDKLAVFPDISASGVFVTVFVLPIAVWWWSVWYPGSEPGGGGYVAQRMLAAKDEANAQGAAFLFNVLHYALRPWPWIVVALCSLVVFPDINTAVREHFPNYHGQPGEDLGYSLMLSFLSPGLLGLVVASLMAAYMSTISTHLNWGASYIANDFYRRFVRKSASEEEVVLVGRVSTALLMALAAFAALQMTNAQQVFNMILTVGAGTGSIFILRWFWWRINAAAELTALVAALAVFLYQVQIHPRVFPTILIQEEYWLLISVAFTTLCWVVAALLSKPTAHATLRRFVEKTRPGGPGWKRVYEEAARSGDPIRHEPDTVHLPTAIVCMIFGSATVYAALFATGEFIYARPVTGSILAAIALLGVFGLRRVWGALSPQGVATSDS